MNPTPRELLLKQAEGLGKILALTHTDATRMEHRKNLIAFCITCHRMKLDTMPSWPQTWGREQFLYQVAERRRNAIPEEGVFMMQDYYGPRIKIDDMAAEHGIPVGGRRPHARKLEIDPEDAEAHRRQQEQFRQALVDSTGVPAKLLTRTKSG